MPLLQILEVLVVVGVLLWLVNRFIPMQGSIKSILNGVVVIAVVLWLLNAFGLFHSLSADPRRDVADPVGQVSHNVERVTQTLSANAAGICLQESILKSKLILAAGITLSLSAFAQTNSQNLTVEPMNTTPTFRVTVISRSVQAVNYQAPQRSFEARFRGHGPHAFGERSGQSRKQEGLHRN